MVDGNMTRHMDATRLPRFRVVEVDGVPIGRNSWQPGETFLLSVSVLDSADAYRELARFDQIDVKPFNMRGELKREALRNRAHGLAAMLEAEYGPQ